jgi:uncharacterized protein (TIGR02246 family)
MKLRRSVVLTLAGVLAACSGETGDQGMAQSAAEVTPEAALEDIRAQYVEHYNMHHPDVVAGFYTDSAVWLAADGNVLNGKAAITAALQAAMGASPTLDLASSETMVVGDHAVTRGTYTLNLTPEGGAPTSATGHYMTYFRKQGDAWKVDRVITNYTTAPVGMPEPTPPATPPPPPAENGTLAEVAGPWAQHFNMGHAEVVANLYTENAVVSFADGSLAEGRAAVSAALAGVIAQGQPQITIHDVQTVDLGNGYVFDAGWFEATATAEGGPQRQMGGYMLLGQRAEDGSLKIHWHYANGTPTPPAG